jgi:WD40 repeat protein
MVRPALWCRFPSRLLGLALVMAAAPWVVSQPPAGQAPVLGDAARARAEALVRKLYAEEFEETKKTAAAAQALAATLLRESKATKDDPALRFAGLSEARDLAARAGDAATCLEAVDELVKHYAVKGLGMKSRGLATAARNATGKEAGLAVVEAALGLIDDALYEDDYAAAATLIEAAETAAARLKNLALYGRVDRRAQEVEAARREFERLKTFADRLAKDAQDAEANYQLGRYSCLIKGNWERGLPLLAKGGHADWQALARKQLANPSSPSVQARLGEDCTRLAEGEKGQPRRNLQRRALYWYQRALPKLAGLTRVRVERELRELAKVFPVPSPTPEIVAELLRIPSPHVGGVFLAVVAPDGRLILSGGFTDKVVRVWDAKTGKELRQLVGATGTLQGLAVSADCKLGAAGDTMNQLRVWDLQTGAQTRQLFGHTDFVRGVQFLPDGKRLVSVSDDKTLRIWDLATGNQLHLLNAHTQYINSLSLTKDGKRAVTASNDLSVAVWDLEKMLEVRRFKHNDRAWAAAIAPDGKRVVSSSLGADLSVRVWDVESGKELRRLPHPSTVWGVAFSPDGKRVYTASGQLPPAPFKKDAAGGMPAAGGPADDYVRVWDVETGKELRRLAGHTALVRMVSVTADGRVAVSCGNDNTIRVWGEKK